MLTLDKLRGVIFSQYGGGLDKDDRKLPEKVMNEMIFHARAQIADERFKLGIDPEWLQEVEIEIENQMDSSGSYLCRNKSPLPDIIMLENDMGFYRIRTKSKNTHKIVEFERVDSTLSTYSRYDRITGKRTKVARIGNNLEIRTSIAMPKVIVLDCILYNPFQVPNFTDKSLFPFSEIYVEQLKAIIAKLDMEIISSSNEKKNDSAQDVRQKEPTRQQ